MGQILVKESSSNNIAVLNMSFCLMLNSLLLSCVLNRSHKGEANINDYEYSADIGHSNKKGLALQCAKIIGKVSSRK